MRLKDLVGLKDNEAQLLSIVAVSANPFDAGVEHWLSELERSSAFTYFTSSAGNNKKYRN